jgi:hypothetical protein
MLRRPGVIRKPAMRPTKRSFNGVEEVSGLTRDACFVFQHSLLRKLYGVPLLSTSERLVARCDGITVDFQRLGLVRSYRQRAVHRREGQL